MTAPELAAAWVRAGGGYGKGPERDALIATIKHGGGYIGPSGGWYPSRLLALRAWRREAKRGKPRTPRGAAPRAKRVPRLVMVTERVAARLDRGETVQVVHAMLAVTP